MNQLNMTLQHLYRVIFTMWRDKAEAARTFAHQFLSQNIASSKSVYICHLHFTVSVDLSQFGCHCTITKAGISSDKRRRSRDLPISLYFVFLLPREVPNFSLYPSRLIAGTRRTSHQKNKVFF
jgi:hypothetical protein